MKMWRTILLLGITVVILSASAFAQRSVDGIAAIVDSQVITFYELRTKLNLLKLEKSKYREVLDQMIDGILISKLINDRGLAATDSEVNEAIEQVRRQNGVTSNSELQALLKEQKVTYGEFRENLKSQIERSKFISYFIAPKVKISEQDVKDYFDREYSQGSQTKLHQISHIVLSANKKDEKARGKARKKAEAILKKLKKGKEFSKVASTDSDGPTAAMGGKLGDFKLDDLQDSFREGIKPLKPGEITDIIETDDGFYIFRLDGFSTPERKSLATAEPEIRRTIQAKEIEREFNLWVRESRSRSFIDIRVKDSKNI